MGQAKLKDIVDFTSSRSFAVIGVSKSSNKFGNTMFKELKKRGSIVHAVHPRAGELNGSPCYASISAIPSKVDAAVICTKPANTLSVVQAAIEAGITKVWLQQGAESEEAVRFAQDRGVTIIAKECLLMYLEPTGFPHNVHKCLWQWLGKLPK